MVTIAIDSWTCQTGKRRRWILTPVGGITLHQRQFKMVDRTDKILALYTAQVINIEAGYGAPIRLMFPRPHLKSEWTNIIIYGPGGGTKVKHEPPPAHKQIRQALQIVLPPRIVNLL